MSFLILKTSCGDSVGVLLTRVRVALLGEGGREGRPIGNNCDHRTRRRISGLCKEVRTEPRSDGKWHLRGGRKGKKGVLLEEEKRLPWKAPRSTPEISLHVIGRTPFREFRPSFLNHQSPPRVRASSLLTDLSPVHTPPFTLIMPLFLFEHDMKVVS